MRPATYLGALFGALFAGPAAGWTIPADQPDGVYRVSYDANGTVAHTLIAPPLSPEEKRSLLSAPKPGRSLPSRITGRQLSNQCNPGGIARGYDFYSIAGTTVAYVCNFGSTSWTCTVNDLTNDYAHITAICGWYQSGWRIRWPATNRGAQIGYEPSWENFCGRGIDG
ncbi:predicted protein [Chaetomium globosum CBS 148.51]|uniref:Secreted protein n=1 Tax=Chaetomium globosum (strain ATCC 6205 / CBS 148.51 / DSM 1962 / NBRC 6347 / NRRL 1970) TaxID=306901 RepID=Q2GRA5_CHAGB|nr:uncharacterized protein CHGG_09499 [Chaetomium globosum CBS 148.51]EAQ85485.1 predicted protein [Chaetomium globosum CBS 148.51]